jgi:hypothetical protein
MTKPEVVDSHIGSWMLEDVKGGRAGKDSILYQRGG